MVSADRVDAGKHPSWALGYAYKTPAVPRIWLTALSAPSAHRLHRLASMGSSRDNTNNGAADASTPVSRHRPSSYNSRQRSETRARFAAHVLVLSARPHANRPTLQRMPPFSGSPGARPADTVPPAEFDGLTGTKAAMDVSPDDRPEALPIPPRLQTQHVVDLETAVGNLSLGEE